MSSCDENTVEFWIKDSIFGNIQPDEFSLVNGVKEILGPDTCDMIQRAVENFDEETQSWRSYRNSLWDCLTDEQNEAVELFLNGPQ